ncbi:MAG: DEAD/DEAH box helicase family protein [Candidatus Helarchaeota archaeon]
MFEVKKYEDLEQLINDYAEIYRKDIIGPAVETQEDLEGNRKLIRYFPELNQIGQQDFPEKNLLRYAFKMATGSGKTLVMALIIVWSYLNKKIEKSSRYADNFLIIAPNVIVYERLAKDFANNRIFYELPLIPPYFKSYWDLKITLRKDNSPLKNSGNLIINNIQQLYESKLNEWSPNNIIDEILGRKPQKEVIKPPFLIFDKIKELDNLIVMNDEGHHVHDKDLEWHKTLKSIHNSLPNGLTLWLDFSATPKFLSGTFFPWIIVDYPLAQAIEDRIVKVPLIVHRIDKEDPDKVNKNNIIEKYGDWIIAALERWKEHYNVYIKVKRKPVLFIMAENNSYADKIADFIKQRKRDYDLSEEEILVIHTNKFGDIKSNDLEKLRKLAADIDNPDNRIKIIVSVLMLREGWDVQNVTICLGLRPFTSKAQILPEQAIGRGLRLMKDISPDYTQTLEIIGTNAFEEFVKQLEIEGVALNTVRKPPPLPVVIAPEISRLIYDIEIPQTDFRYERNYMKLNDIKIENIPSLYESEKLEEERIIKLQMIFPVTETNVHIAEIERKVLPMGAELITYLTKEIMKKAHITSCFNKLYPIVKEYVLNKCFNVKIKNIEDKKLRSVLTDVPTQEAIIDLLVCEIGQITIEKKEISLKSTPLKLSEVDHFIWRRKHLRLKKTVFNFVAVYNNFEAEFAEFLDRCSDIEKFAAIANLFKIDYLSSRGTIRFYIPDFIAVQNVDNKKIFWIIETKGREFPDTKRKDNAMRRWCNDVSKQSEKQWKYIKVFQKVFNTIKNRLNSFSDLINFIENENS